MRDFYRFAALVLTRSSIQEHHLSIPSPVLQETSKNSTLGFSPVTERRKAAISKSTWGRRSILFIITASASPKIRGYLIGLYSPSGRLEITTLLCSPRATSAGQM